MSGTAAFSEAVETFLLTSVMGDARAGVRMALGMLDAGTPKDDVIVNLLGAAQREVGERWLRNEWTVADEHLVSGVTQKALDAVANSVDPPTEGGLVVVACAEGDWHSLPAQMFAETLRWEGFAVAFLGASTPVDHVAALMTRRRPDALAVSCNLPLFFSGVTRLVDAAHLEGVPVIAGGRALGGSAARASRLGADAWAKDVDDAATVLRSWQHEKPHVPAEPTRLDPAALQLDARAGEIAAVAFESLCAAYPPMASYSDRQLARTREDLAFIAQFLAAARLVDDDSVLTDMVDWLKGLLAVRGVPAAAVTTGLRVLAPIVGETDPAAGELARAAC